MRTIVLTLMLSLNLSAQTIQVEAPLTGIVDHPECGELVALSGVLHGTITQVVNKNQTLFTSQVGPRGDAFAVGMDSGIRYNLVGNTKTQFASDSNFLKSFSYVNTFKIIGLYSIKHDIHVLLNDDGSINLQIEKLTSTCK